MISNFSSKLILVDEFDNELGVGEKLDVHRRGLRHRAFSVIIRDKEGKLLIQKRAISKYHSGGLWSNTCCGHPSPNENLLNEAKKRLEEEMGFTCELKKQFSFDYRAILDNDLIENEIDHVFIGHYNKNVNPNRLEVEDYKWISLEDLKEDIICYPQKYTVWFKILINKHSGKLF